MNKLRTLYQSLERELPRNALLKLDAPLGSEQPGWLDIEYRGKWVAVEWKPKIGFGVSLLEGIEDNPLKGLFEGPDKVFDNWREAQKHILSLLLNTSEELEPRPLRVAARG